MGRPQGLWFWMVPPFFIRSAVGAKRLSFCFAPTALFFFFACLPQLRTAMRLLQWLGFDRPIRGRSRRVPGVMGAVADAINRVPTGGRCGTCGLGGWLFGGVEVAEEGADGGGELVVDAEDDTRGVVGYTDVGFELGVLKVVALGGAEAYDGDAEDE